MVSVSVGVDLYGPPTTYNLDGVLVQSTPVLTSLGFLARSNIQRPTEELICKRANLKEIQLAGTMSENMLLAGMYASWHTNR